MYIDVSHNNGVIDWNRVKNNPIKIDGVWIKCNEGVKCIDSMLNTNANGANAAGLPIGYYHFATLNSTDVVNDAIGEAAEFVGLIKNLPKYSLPLVLDIEDDDNVKKFGITPTQVLLWINTFMAELKKAGHTNLMLYSYTPFLTTNLPVSHNLGGYPLWVAAYSAKYATPRGWLGAKYWQYSNTGSVSGIKGNVDLSKVV